MGHDNPSFQSLRSLFPAVESPVTCNDIYNRIPPIRDLICDALGAATVYKAVLDKQTPEQVALHQLFESDRNLRERLAEVLLVVFLSVEGHQEPSETLKDSPPEIRNRIVLCANCFYHWFCTKAEHQKEGRLDRGSLALTWTYLFAEFRKDLEYYRQDRWFRSLQEPFVDE